MSRMQVCAAPDCDHEFPSHLVLRYCGAHRDEAEREADEILAYVRHMDHKGRIAIDPSQSSPPVTP